MLCNDLGCRPSYGTKMVCEHRNRVNVIQINVSSFPGQPPSKSSSLEPGNGSPPIRSYCIMGLGRIFLVIWMGKHGDGQSDEDPAISTYTFRPYCRNVHGVWGQFDRRGAALYDVCPSPSPAHPYVRWYTSCWYQLVSVEIGRIDNVGWCLLSLEQCCWCQMAVD